MIEFKYISKTFRSDLLTKPFVALKDVSFSVPSGSMVGFLGANGAGKTTSLKIIMDFIRADAGEVSFSRNLGRTKEECFRNIGFLPERPYFYPHLTGNQFLQFMGELSDVAPSVVRDEVKKLAPRFGIDHALDRPLRSYSKGMLQRVGFLSTIVHHPKLVILDEPLSGLDPIGRKELKDVMVDLHREGKTVFFSSHIVPDIEEVCDRVVFLKEGMIAYDGPVRSLLSGTSESNHELLTNGYVPGFDDSLQKLPDGSYRYRFKAEAIDQFLRIALSNNVQILGLEQIKPSLEEIFYKTRG